MIIRWSKESRSNHEKFMINHFSKTIKISKNYKVKTEIMSGASWRNIWCVMTHKRYREFQKWIWDVTLVRHDAQELCAMTHCVISVPSWQIILSVMTETSQIAPGNLYKIVLYSPSWRTGWRCDGHMKSVVTLNLCVMTDGPEFASGIRGKTVLHSPSWRTFVRYDGLMEFVVT